MRSSDSTSSEIDGVTAPDKADAAEVGKVGQAAATKISTRDISARFGRKGSMAKAGGASLRLTRQQRILLREGLADLRQMFEDAEHWEQAANESFQAEDELGISHLGAGFCMWNSSMAALTYGAWWLLMPSCGAPVLQDTVCDSLTKPFLERRPEYVELRRAIEDEGRYSALAKVLERTERIRCMLTLHVQKR